MRRAKTISSQSAKIMDGSAKAPVDGLIPIISAAAIMKHCEFKSPHTFNKYAQTGIWGDPFTLDDHDTAKRFYSFEKFKTWLEDRIKKGYSEKNLSDAIAQQMLGSGR